MNLLCAGGIPPEIVNNSAFRALVDHLDPTNGIVVASTFSSSYIPAEAARVTALAIGKLKTEYNLNLGYDGGTTKGKQSIYTFHVTTADRECYLIKGDEASGFSHTGEHICKLILQVCLVAVIEHINNLILRSWTQSGANGLRRWVVIAQEIQNSVENWPSWKFSLFSSFRTQTTTSRSP
jgi:hypothetical protein